MTEEVVAYTSHPSILALRESTPVKTKTSIMHSRLKINEVNSIQGCSFLHPGLHLQKGWTSGVEYILRSQLHKEPPRCRLRLVLRSPSLIVQPRIMPFLFEHNLSVFCFDFAGSGLSGGARRRREPPTGSGAGPVETTGTGPGGTGGDRSLMGLLPAW